MTMNKILVSQPHVDSLMWRDNVLDVFFPCLPPSPASFLIYNGGQLTLGE